MMKKLFLTMLLASTFSFASQIEIEDAYVRATPPAVQNSAAFMTIRNSSSKNILLVKASSDVAKVVELHTHEMKNGVMKMYQVPSIEILANKEVSLNPGGYHIMLIELNKALKTNDTITLKLVFSDNSTKEITVPVRTIMDGMNHQNHKMMNHN
ncbi:copper chaperone PCu(A)C [Halarcobacter ebronensis]|nr:copper chaperone PCu(A)C [Halarcobacter ebronensis]QKF81326.1 copper chaperone PCu(A)C [Halarcobacter ebronensis]